MDVFVLFTYILLKICPILQLSELLCPIYGVRSTFFVLVCLQNHFCSPVMDLQCFKWKIDLKIDKFLFLTLILANFGPFTSLRAPTANLCLTKYMLDIVLFENQFYRPFMDLQCFKWKIGLKILYFLPLFQPILALLQI